MAFYFTGGGTVVGRGEYEKDGEGDEGNDKVVEVDDDENEDGGNDW